MFAEPGGQELLELNLGIIGGCSQALLIAEFETNFSLTAIATS